MRELQGERRLAATRHAGEANHFARLETLSEIGQFGFAANRKRRTRWQWIQARRRRGTLGEQPSADLTEAFELVGAEIEIFFVSQEVWQLAIAIEDPGQFGAAIIGLIPESVGPFFLHPGGGDRIGRDDEEDKVRV